MRYFFSLLWILSPLVVLAAQTAPQGSEAISQEQKNFRYEEVVLGAANAPVTIIEYSAFTCGHCAEFHKNVIPKLKKNYIDRGKVKLVFRSFPMDAYALKISSVLSQVPTDRRWQTLHEVFDHQANWMKGDFIKEIAYICGISEGECKRFMEDQGRLKHLAHQLQYAYQVHKVNATPTFFVNGTKIESALTYEQFDLILKKVLT